MVSMEKSMKKALNVIICCIIWWIVGIILIFIGNSMIKTQDFILYILSGKFPDIFTLIGILIILIGIIIIILAFLASFMKVLTELIVEEINVIPDNNIKSENLNKLECEHKFETIEKYGYVCGKCGEEVLPLDKFCKNCNETIEWKQKEEFDKNNMIFYFFILLIVVVIFIWILQIVG